MRSLTIEGGRSSTLRVDFGRPYSSESARSISAACSGNAFLRFS